MDLVLRSHVTDLGQTSHELIQEVYKFVLGTPLTEGGTVYACLIACDIKMGITN